MQTQQKPLVKVISISKSIVFQFLKVLWTHWEIRAHWENIIHHLKGLVITLPKL